MTFFLTRSFHRAFTAQGSRFPAARRSAQGGPAATGSKLSPKNGRAVVNQHSGSWWVGMGGRKRGGWGGCLFVFVSGHTGTHGCGGGFLQHWRRGSRGSAPHTLAAGPGDGCLLGAVTLRDTSCASRPLLSQLLEDGASRRGCLGRSVLLACVTHGQGCSLARELYVQPGSAGALRCLLGFCCGSRERDCLLPAARYHRRASCVCGPGGIPVMTLNKLRPLPGD